MLSYKASLNLKALAVVLFGVYLAVAAELFLQLSALISIRFVLPTIALSLAFVAALDVQFAAALGLTLPSFNVNLQLALEYELGIVLGLIASIKAILSGSLVAYAYTGSGASFGSTLDAAISGGWPDGTPPGEQVTAYLFVATASGPLTPDQVDTVSIVPPAATPPTPPPPSPPAGSYPPPQLYTMGLAGVTFPSAISPAIVYPADPARGTVAITTTTQPTGFGAVTGVTITHHGSGYTAPPFALISDSVSIVSATSATPIVVTLPAALSVPVGHGVAVTLAGVEGSTAVLGATNATPIVIEVASTTSLATCSIAGALGNAAANGQWYCQALDATHAALWLDAALSVPSTGSGAYTGGGLLAANANGLQNGKVLAGQTTIALYSDSALTVPVVGLGTYSGGTVTGSGQGAVATPTMGGQQNSSLTTFFNGLTWPAFGPSIVGGATTLEVLCSATFALLAALLANLTARSKVLLAASASASIQVLPPSLTASISLLAKITTNLSANLNVTLPSFSISAQLSAVAALVAQLQLALGIGNADLEIWEYTGAGSGFGAAIAAGPGASGWHDGTSAASVVAAGVFGLTSSATLSTFKSFFGGLP